MAIKISLTHRTSYEFDRLITLSPHILRLRPAPHTRTPILSYSLKVKPANHFINWQQDSFGNFLARLVFPEPTKNLEIEVGLSAEMTAINPFDFFLEEAVENYPFDYKTQTKKELMPYLEVVDKGPKLLDFVSEWRGKSQRTIDFLVEINASLQHKVAYTVRLEPGTQSSEETLTKGSGSCRDSAWLLVQALRHLGIAARFVSGYLVQLRADIAALDGPTGPSEDFTDLHAWAEAYIPGAGWVGLDPTSGLFAGEGHIPLACAADVSSAAPIEGATDPCEVQFEYQNQVQRIHEDPRVTLPYAEHEWEAIDNFGQQIDKQLQADDVRLTMGGEPTFISIDDFDAAEWNTAADGPHKRERAEALMKRLSKSFTDGGLLHYGQGKWYPGEPLPRWQLSCYFRNDGKPLWHNSELQADVNKHYDVSIETAQRFMSTLARRLTVSEQCIVPAFEDALHYALQEGDLPVDWNADDPRWADEAERQSLRKQLERGLDTPSGYVLPITWNYQFKCWSTCQWQFRRGQLILMPGDSPLGLRLPISSLSIALLDNLDEPVERDPLDPRPDLATSEQDTNPTTGTSENKHQIACQTALAVEVRDQRLYVFMPPLAELEHYLALIRAVEECAEACMTPVVIEGYTPPSDPRINKFMITPDPGVIEVNVHPAKDWNELKHITTTLYEEAHQARLTSVRYELDGQQAGTGGGNHVTLGGETPADSPILRRPDLLRSLITYWQHHPGLSYLFSGMFVGPTSQAPRVDEGRPEMLYELETAFDLLPQGDTQQLWLVDRLLRHLLTDITGNTHRAEFCIDKLYSPDSAQGRLGLLELRSFEMPPHARMSLVQMLLIRTLVARFWRKPYHHKLIRWGTQLHDRYMMPHYVWQDVLDVVNDLNRDGYNFQAQWLMPFAEFRFPVYGRQTIGDIEMELRAAIEPWHVLGEESNSQGTARYVDSSVERVQIKINRLIPDRYLLCCNGAQIPLHNTGTVGEYVGAIRYRAWQPPSALHPTIPVHSPLVFDLIDRWNGLSLGGFTYHVAHPGGRNFENFPVNSFEAEGRRHARFWTHGYNVGSEYKHFQTPKRQWHFEQRSGQSPSKTLPELAVSPEFPYTLDLRKLAKS